MTVKVINLNKLLKLFALDDAKLRSELRADLRTERDKLRGKKLGGGDFHSPFWSDCKTHVIGAVPLSELTKIRIEDHKPRERLYVPLAKGFLNWFDELKRSTNKKVGWSEIHAHNHHDVPSLDLIVKVDNILGIKIGEDTQRLVYPYFSEEPILQERWARVGLWLMDQALQDVNMEEIQILDVLRGRSFDGDKTFFTGTEERDFNNRYSHIRDRWLELRPEYGLP